MRALGALLLLLISMVPAPAWSAGIDFTQKTRIVELELRDLFKQRPLPVAEIEEAIAGVVRDRRPALHATLGNLMWQTRDVPSMTRVRANYLYDLEQSKGRGATAHHSLLMNAGPGNASSNGTDALAQQYLAPLASSANESLEQMIREANGQPLTRDQVGRHAELVENYQSSARHFGVGVQAAKARLEYSHPDGSLGGGETRKRLIARVKALAKRLAEWQAQKRAGGVGVYRSTQAPLPQGLIQEIEEAELDLLVYEAQVLQDRSGISPKTAAAAARWRDLIFCVLSVQQGIENARLGAISDSSVMVAVGLVQVVWGLVELPNALEEFYLPDQKNDEERSPGFVLRAAAKVRQAYAAVTEESYRLKQRTDFEQAVQKEMAQLTPEDRKAAEIMLAEFRRSGADFNGIAPPAAEPAAPEPRVRIGVDSSASEPLPAQHRKRIDIREEEFLPDEESSASGTCLRQTLRMVRGR